MNSAAATLSCRRIVKLETDRVISICEDNGFYTLAAAYAAHRDRGEWRTSFTERRVYRSPITLPRWEEGDGVDRAQVRMDALIRLLGRMQDACRDRDWVFGEVQLHDERSAPDDDPEVSEWRVEIEAVSPS